MHESLESPRSRFLCHFIMSRIQQLDPHVINRIAAGEVIERPASVVKELMENSIDALSTRIEIDIVAGGTELIRISDNGEGMHPDDLTLSVTSHATSKIRSDHDLQKVSTLGFRGEALASVASISRFRIRTRRQGLPIGRELEAEGGEISILRECGCPTGTVIEVHNLFFNTPARRKFLKKPSTEFGRISEQFTKLALPNPNLHLVLRHNDKLVYELPATSNQMERIRRFFGGEIADKLIQVESEITTEDGQHIRLWGYVGDPSLSKGTRKDQYLFLNGRCIQDRSLQHALGEAYRGLLMVGRHPVSFLFLEVPPNLVDVNVHPTKTEVRFQDGQSLYRQLLHTIRDKFLSLDFQSEIQVPSVTRSGTGAISTQSSQLQKELDIWSSSPIGTNRVPLIERPDKDPNYSTGQYSKGQTASSFGSSDSTANSGFTGGGKASVFKPAVTEALSAITEAAHGSVGIDDATGTRDNSTEQQLPSEFSLAADTDDDSTNSETSEAGVQPEARPSDAENLRQQQTVYGDDFRAFQIHDCYLVVASPDGLQVIDQHALHERIVYEHLRNRVLQGNVERQKLLLPEAIDCTAGEAAVLLEYQELLAEIGFELEDFGGTTVLLQSHPVMLPRGNFVKILKDLAGQLEESDGKTSRRDLLDHMMHTMACRAAIKAGQRLAPEEMQELLRQRHLVDDAHHCPHGRPTSLTLSRLTLDKQFGRLG